jgi:putative transposase
VHTWSGFVYVAFVIDSMLAGSWAGGPAALRMQTSFWMPWNKPYTSAGSSAGMHSSIIPIAAVSMFPSSTRTGWPSPALSLLSAASEILTTRLSATINGLNKAELIHGRRPWRSFEAVEFPALEWVDWFNNRRLLGPMGNIPPAEAELRYYASLESPAKVA